MEIFNIKLCDTKFTVFLFSNKDSFNIPEVNFAILL